MRATSPCRIPEPRALVCGRSPAPRDRPAATSSITQDQRPGRRSLWVIPNVSGRPLTRLTSSIRAISAIEFWRSLPSRSPMRGTISMTPRPRSLRALAMPASSSARAKVPGSSRPSLTVCMKLREVEKPSAPASLASPTSAAICAMSVSSAGASPKLRSP